MKEKGLLHAAKVSDRVGSWRNHGTASRTPGTASLGIISTDLGVLQLEMQTRHVPSRPFPESIDTGAEKKIVCNHLIQTLSKFLTDLRDISLRRRRSLRKYNLQADVLRHAHAVACQSISLMGFRRLTLFDGHVDPKLESLNLIPPAPILHYVVFGDYLLLGWGLANLLDVVLAGH